MLEIPSVQGYIVFNHQGIAMRYDGKGITQKKAIHYAALMTDYWGIVKKTLNRTLNGIFNKSKENDQEIDIEYIRMRMKNQHELIITATDKFFLVCIQNCGKNKKKKNQTDKKDVVSEEEKDDN